MELENAVKDMLSPAAIAMIAGVMVIWAGSHVFGVGFAVDAVMLVSGVVFLGLEIWDIADDFGDYLSKTAAAETQAQLDEASNHLARIIVVLGVEVFMVVIAKAGGRIAGAARKEAEVQLEPQDRKTDGLDEVEEASAIDFDNSYEDLDKSYISQSEQIGNASTFQTQGVDNHLASNYLVSDDGQNMLDALWAADPNAEASTVYARAMDQLSTGSELPIATVMDDALVKIVPEGSMVSPYSPFFTTPNELSIASNSDVTLADYFGLPLNSESPKYSIFEIKPLQSATVFYSPVAPTTELGGLINRAGGGAQYLVPNRSLWSDPVIVGVIDN